MSYILVTDFAPLYVLRRVGPMGAPEMTAMTTDMIDVIDKSPEKTAWIYDSGPNPEGRPDAAARQVVGDWFRKHGPTVARRVVGYDFAFPSAISRGVLTAIIWITPMPVPTSIHDSLRRAVTSSLARLSSEPAGGVSAVVEAVERRAKRAQR